MQHLGEEGTEQFTVTTRVNDEKIGEQKIHDPFIRTRVVLKGFGHAWRALFGGITVQVTVDASHGAMRAVMMLDPEKLEEDSAEFLRQMAVRREWNEQNGVVGYCQEQSATLPTR